MIAPFYAVLISYFVLGGVLTWYINKKKEADVRRQSWLKYWTYFVIVNGLFVSILTNEPLFRVICGVILIFGLFELIKVTIKTRKYLVGGISVCLFLFLALGFLGFSGLSGKVLFFTFFITVVFDAISQLSGQLLGKQKLVPKISPNKTVEGFVGGLLVAVLTSLLFGDLLEVSAGYSALLGLGVALFAFLGDLSASFCKRCFGVKDFSNWIPGHGGFLDRFDSFLAAGAFVYIVVRCQLL